MSYTSRQKVAVIKKYQNGMSLRQIERKFGVDRKEVRRWVSCYETDGIKGLKRKKYKRTSYETRCEIVRDVVENGNTLSDTIDKYGISRSTLKLFLSKFRSGGYEALHPHKKFGDSFTAEELRQYEDSMKGK